MVTVFPHHAKHPYQEKGVQAKGIYEIRSKVQGARYRVQGARFKVQGSRCKVQGARFKENGKKVQGGRAMM
jgi:hypothetical protein